MSKDQIPTDPTPVVAIQRIGAIPSSGPSWPAMPEHYVVTLNGGHRLKLVDIELYKAAVVPPPAENCPRCGAHPDYPTAVHLVDCLPRHPDRDPLDSDFGPHDHPELQIRISEEGLKRAGDVLARDPYITEPEKAAALSVAAALTSPPTVTEQTVETLVRALLATYPDHRWDGIKLRQMVEGLLLSLGVEVS